MAAAPPPQIFEPPIFGEQQEKIWATPVFKEVFMFFFFYYYCFIIFYVFKLLTRSRRNILVKFTRDSGCLARDEFLGIMEGYQMLISIFVFFYCSALH